MSVSRDSRRKGKRLGFDTLEPRLLLSTSNSDILSASLLDTIQSSNTALSTSAITSNITSPAPTASAPRQMEQLDRGVVAINQGSGKVYVGWRLLGTDPSNMAFNLYRSAGGGTAVKLNSSPITTTTNFVDTTANTALSNSYFVKPVIGGVEQAASESFILKANAPIQSYLGIPLQIPAGVTTLDGVTCTYSANDCSVGDLDGDGQYEIIVKWDPSNSQDNSISGYTGNVYLDAYKLTGDQLWRIDLGKNIRAGAHYTQFMVYDLDGDGLAEVACKTAPGTKDGLGNNVILGTDDPNADYRNSSGYILSGPEYMTVFNGLTGAAMATTNYLPARGTVSSWGDSYGNRVDRFLACVAYLDGTRPSLVMCRGYYTRAVLVAWDWRDGQLTQRWTFDTNTSGNSGYKGQGNHSISVADVDTDGKDEIVYGACSIDDDGTGIYTTGLGHGDALHVGDLDPDRPGLEVFQIHETPSTTAGVEFRDAATGTLIWGLPSTGDVGRGVSDDIYAGTRGAESWAAGYGLYDRYGNNIGRAPGSCNFLVWWDGDHVRELLDGNHIDKYGLSGDTRLLTASGVSSNNSTKSTPCLSADILGDWREEVIWRASDSSELRIYTTTTPAEDRIYTLMHDPQYRLSIAWQNVAYNQPPHTGFYLGDGMSAPPTPNIYLVSSGLVPPVAPTGLTAVKDPSALAVNLNWTASTGAVSYVIKRSLKSGGPYDVIASGIATTQYVDTDILQGGRYYYVVSARDSVGMLSNNSAESCVTIPPIIPWTVQDIGSVGIPGQLMYDRDHFILYGSGPLDSNDGLFLASQNVSGNSTIIVHVDSQTSLTGNGGLMFRKSTSSTSAYASIVATSDAKNHIFFNYRTSDGGTGTYKVGYCGVPVWLKLTRVGTTFTGYYSTDNINWTQVGSATISSMPTTALGGMCGSAGAGTVCVTQFSNFMVTNGTTTNTLPTVAINASASPVTVSALTTNLSVLGADDTGETNLSYCWSVLGTPPAPVTFSKNYNNSAKSTTATFSKAGTYTFQATIIDAGGSTATSNVIVTVNQTLTSMALTPELSTITAGSTLQLTASLLDQFGNAMSSQPTFTWTLESGSGTISSSGLYTAPNGPGLAVIKAASPTMSKKVTITTSTGDLFANGADIGSLSLAGSDSYANGTYTLSGAGTDIWNTSDEFHYAYTSITGNGIIIARVPSETNTNSWAKAGVMFRNTLDANSAYAMLCVTPTKTNGLSFQYRANASGSAATNANYTGVTAPYWIRLTRVDNTFKAERSVDGITWTQVGTAQTISMNQTIYVGLAACSHNTASLMTATFDNVVATSSPTIGTAANASSNPVTGTATGLSVLGNDDNGQANLTYTWSTIGTPPAPVSFSVNGTNAAKNTTAAFTKFGTYNFLVTISDSAGLSISSTISVAVNQTLTTIVVTPSTASIASGASQQFMAAGLDQFGTAMSATYSWSIKSGLGSINSTGLYTAPASSTTAIVQAASSGKTGSATVNVVVAAGIVSRKVFYNNSKFDVISDGNAIATDKEALLPGGTAVFANYTSFDKGINGIIIDIAHLANPAALSAADFTFKLGNDNDPASWIAAPAPVSVTVDEGAGAGGSDRVFIIFADRAVKNTWLKTTVLANANTGLAAADVFYFGNAVADCGNSQTDAIVSVEDESLAWNNRSGFSSAGITNSYDYNRDGRVTVADALLARHNKTDSATSLRLITVPADGPLSAATMIEPIAAPTASMPTLSSILMSTMTPLVLTASEVARGLTPSKPLAASASADLPLFSARAYLASLERGLKSGGESRFSALSPKAESGSLVQSYQQKKGENGPISAKTGRLKESFFAQMAGGGTIREDGLMGREKDWKGLLLECITKEVQNQEMDAIIDTIFAFKSKRRE